MKLKREVLIYSIAVKNEKRGEKSETKQKKQRGDH